MPLTPAEYKYHSKTRIKDKVIQMHKNMKINLEGVKSSTFKTYIYL